MPDSPQIARIKQLERIRALESRGLREEPQSNDVSLNSLPGGPPNPTGGSLLGKLADPSPGNRIRSSDPRMDEAFQETASPEYKQSVKDYVNGMAMGVGTSQGVLESAAQNTVYGGAHAVGEGRDPKKEALESGLATLLLGGAGKAASKVGDYGMQMAVGRSKYTPGVGTELSDQGVWGGRGMMRNQVNQRLEDTGQAMHDIAKQVPPDVVRPASDIAAPIGQKLQSQMEPVFGNPSASDIPQINQIKDFRQDIASRGEENLGQMLQRRAAAGSRAKFKDNGQAGSALNNQLSKQEQQGYSDAAKKLASEHDPELGDQLADADFAYGSLKRAQEPLSKEAGMPTSLMSLLSNKYTNYLGAPLALSTAGQASSKLGNVGEQSTSLIPFLFSKQDK